MRQIVLDTETTGLEPDRGHKIIEIGGVELVNRRPTGRNFHKYLNPERDIDEGALAVHGITREFLADKPRFADVLDELLEFISGAELVIHNAAFDVGFLDVEMRKARGAEARSTASYCGILDTLALARGLHPGQRNSLDALCKRYSVDNSRRELHGALLDARILADVYLAMTGGQSALALVDERHAAGHSSGREVRALVRPSCGLTVVRATPSEYEAHASLLALIAKASGGKPSLFQALDATNSSSEPARAAHAS